MTKQVQRRRGTSSQHTSFTGAEGEISVNTSNKTIHVHDGSTAGGFESALANLDNVGVADVSSALAGVTNIDINGGTIDGTTIGGNSAAAITGTTVTGTSFVSSGNMTFGDNDKAIFGAGSDLQIYHDGSHSVINDVGTGHLKIQGTDIRIQSSNGAENFLVADENGAVRLYNNDSQKFQTTSTGVDISGTITSDGLTVDGVATVNSNILEVSSTAPNIRLTETDITDENTQLFSGGGTFRIRTASDDYSTVTERIRIDHGTGDISFYDNQGSSQSFFWDASAESLGIGTTTFPSSNTRIAIQGTQGASGSGTNVAADEFFIDNNGDTGMTLGSANDGVGYYAFADPDVAIRGGLFYDHSTDDMGFRVASQTRMTLDSGGKVGIGTALPLEPLHVQEGGSSGMTPRAGTIALIEGVGNTKVSIASGTTSTGELLFGSSTDNDAGRVIYDHSSDDLSLYTNSNERMRIDSVGNVGIGTDSPKTNLDLSSVTGPQITLTRSDGANNAGDTLGRLNFYNSDFSGDGANNAAIIEAVASASTGSSADLLFRTKTAGTEGADAVEAMRIDRDGNVGIGTSSPANVLEINKNSSGTVAAEITNTHATGSGSTRLILNNGSDTNGNGFHIINNANDGAVNLLNYKNTPLAFWTNASEAMRIHSTGNVTIGSTSDMGAPLLVFKADSTAYNASEDDGQDGSGATIMAWNSDQADDGFAQILFRNRGSGVGVSRIVSIAQGSGSTDLAFVTEHSNTKSEKMRIDSIGNVGIGTSSPASQVHLAGGVNGTLRVDTTASGYLDLSMYSNGGFVATSAAQPLRFGVSNAEAMRIDSSGNLLVGTTDSNVSNNSGASNNGINLLATGQVFAAYAGNVANFNQLGTSGGSIINFDVDGSTVGSIGADSTRLTIGSGDTGLLIAGDLDNITPYNTSTNVSRDAAVDLGNSGVRFKDLYLSSKTKYQASGGNQHSVGVDANDLIIRSETAGSETARFTYDGRVGIGTSNPLEALHVYDDSAATDSQGIRNSTYRPHLTLEDLSSNSKDWQVWADSGDLSFLYGDVSSSGTDGAKLTSEAMRIDSSGNLLVGKVSADATVTGGEIRATGVGIFTTTDGYPLQLRRYGSDGSIIDLRKDGTTVGSIGARSAALCIDFRPGSAGLSGTASNRSIVPGNGSGGLIDNVIDLGLSSYRFDDIYATNGTIQTSDRNEKQDIASLTPTEMLVAARLSTGFKNFRWKDSVAEKGAAARMHSGAIAQDVQAAFIAEGLDAGDYALFTSATWWTHDVDVPAVEAVAEVVDEDGVVVTEAVEAVAAYTRTDTYDTEAEAPVGAVSKTRLGVRYPELLSFVAAYNEQRFASIETRLTALEAV
jgi:hypothetical protein